MIIMVIYNLVDSCHSETGSGLKKNPETRLEHLQAIHSYHATSPTISVTAIQHNLREVDFTAALPLVSPGSYYPDRGTEYVVYILLSLAHTETAEEDNLFRRNYSKKLAFERWFLHEIWTKDSEDIIIRKQWILHF